VVGRVVGRMAGRVVGRVVGRPVDRAIGGTAGAVTGAFIGTKVLHHGGIASAGLDSGVKVGLDVPEVADGERAGAGSKVLFFVGVLYNSMEGSSWMVI
jgi:hypothetical protein